MLSMEAFLSLYESTKEPQMAGTRQGGSELRRKLDLDLESADAAGCGRRETPLEEGRADRRASGDYGSAAGGVDEYLDWAVPSYAKLYNYTKDPHYLDVARVLLHDTKSMVALPGRQYDMKGIGWQQEGWRMGPGGPDAASEATGSGCRGFPPTTSTASRAWRNSIRPCINNWQEGIEFRHDHKLRWHLPHSQRAETARNSDRPIHFRCSV